MTDKEWIASLQAALSFWLPMVQGGDEMAKRIADDAMLLFGMNHADADKPSAEKLGWITVNAAPAQAEPSAMTPEEAFALREQNKFLVDLYDAVKNLIKVKGRHHSEAAYQRLVAAFEVAQRG